MATIERRPARASLRHAVAGGLYAQFDVLALAILDWAEDHYVKGIL